MPECPVLYTGMNGILLVPSPLGERDRVRGEKKEPSPSPLSSPSRERRLFF